MVGLARGKPGRDRLIAQKQQRRQQHRQADHQLRHLAGQHRQSAFAARDGDDQKAELAALRQPQREQHAVAPFQPEDQRHHVQDRHLDHDQAQHGPDDQHGVGDQQGKVDPHPHRHEEQPHQQPLERLQIGLQLVAKLGIGQHDAGDKGAKGRRQADQQHQKPDAQHHQKRDEGRHFRQPRGMDKAKHRAAQEMPGQHDPGDDGHGQKRHLPRRQAVDQRHQRLGHPLGCGPAGCNGLRRQKRQDGQHGHHRQILHQQHGEGRPPARGADQPLFRQGLQHDGG